MAESDPFVVPDPALARTRRELKTWQRYFYAVCVVTICGFVCWGGFSIGLSVTNVAMCFLAGVAMVAVWFGHGPGVLAALLGMFVFDFMFIEPRLGFSRSDSQYFVTFGVMIGISLLISELTARLQKQLRESRRQERRTAELFLASQRRERRTSLLYQITRHMSGGAPADELLNTAGDKLREYTGDQVGIFLCGAAEPLELCYGDPQALGRDPELALAAGRVAHQRRPVGQETAHFARNGWHLFPMIGSQRMIGVLVLPAHQDAAAQDAEELQLLETCARLIALSIERDQLIYETQQAQLQVQSEQLRNSLLSSVSHDLRTPLAMIAVTASGLLENSTEQTWSQQREMLQTVVDASHRLARQVENLLGMARLDSGKLILEREWESIEELLEVALARLRQELKNHTILAHIPPDLSLLWVAGELFEPVLVNLLENASRYTPPGSTIEISVRRCGEQVEITIADDGPGLPAGTELKVFDKFFRGGTEVADGQWGIGMGLAICQGIVKAHGGEIRVESETGKGS
ncbi:MAG TPA: DUF4118 domain-containing protein, partial [Pirellulales bacterium]|nr:DUF4118 domain-containing protein [Pirellulales bacterium]